MSLNYLSLQYQESLILNKSAQEYLLNRGFIEKTYSEFGVGWCNSGQFKNRIMFPIYDLEGETVGFGGRSINGESPKYLNSSESETYKKSRLLYNLNSAQDFILQERFAILTEGYFDVMRLWQAGIKNVVASCGTALTAYQLRLLKRFADYVVLCFDGDSSGQSSAARVMDSLKDERFQIKSIKLPEMMDPDSFIDNYGVVEFRRLLNSV